MKTSALSRNQLDMEIRSQNNCDSELININIHLWSLYNNQVGPCNNVRLPQSPGCVPIEVAGNLCSSMRSSMSYCQQSQVPGWFGSRKPLNPGPFGTWLCCMCCTLVFCANVYYTRHHLSAVHWEQADQHNVLASARQTTKFRHRATTASKFSLKWEMH
jgi:hypothetical protein